MFLRRYFYSSLVCFLFFIPGNIFGQRNIMGKPGYISVPSASWIDGEPLGFSFSTIPDNYSLFGSNTGTNRINFYNVRADITSFFGVNLSIANRPERSERIGVGDRQFDMRFRLFKETEYRPAVVIGWTPPGSRLPILAHDYIVFTKNFRIGNGNLELSSGYGSPFVITRNKNEDNTFWKSLRLQNKYELYGNDYLYGFFGAIKYQPITFGGVMLEYDSNTLNAGAYVQPWDWFILQVQTYEVKEFAFSFALSFPLDFSPKSLRRYE